MNSVKEFFLEICKNAVNKNTSKYNENNTVLFIFKTAKKNTLKAYY